MLPCALCVSPTSSVVNSPFSYLGQHSESPAPHSSSISPVVRDPRKRRREVEGEGEGAGNKRKKHRSEEPEPDVKEEKEEAEVGI